MRGFYQLSMHHANSNLALCHLDLKTHNGGTVMAVGNITNNSSVAPTPVSDNFRSKQPSQAATSSPSARTFNAAAQGHGQLNHLSSQRAATRSTNTPPPLPPRTATTDTPPPLPPRTAAAFTMSLPLPPGTVTARTPPPLPPRNAAAGTPPPLPPRTAAAVTPPPLPPRNAAAVTPPPLPPRNAAAGTPPPLPPRNAAARTPPAVPPRAAASTANASDSSAPSDG